MAQITQGTVANLGLAGQWLWVSVGNRTLRALATTNISSRRVTVMIDDRGKVTISDPNAARPVLPPRTERFHQGQRKKVEERFKYHYGGVIREAYRTTPPVPTGGTSQPATTYSYSRYWLYLNNRLTIIPRPMEWEFVADAFGQNLPALNGPVTTLQTLGISIGGYNTTPSGRKQSVAYWRWSKIWYDSDPEPAQWTATITTVAQGQEGNTTLGRVYGGTYPLAPSFLSTVHHRVKIYFFPLQEPYLSASDKKFYLYNFLSSSLAKDEFGVYYYSFPIGSTPSFASPGTRFDVFPSFVGASDDWLQYFPNNKFGTTPALSCYQSRYPNSPVNITTNFADNTRYEVVTAPAVQNPGAIAIESRAVRANTLILCQLDPARPVTIQHPGIPLNQFPNFNEPWASVDWASIIVTRSKA